ncbi:MAG: L-seryl-tRNA(Sec) selenium transferase [Candidatus Sumerlaeota bacterium]|nr:L-seryl-tRNA(Sec) selenium transferase [Candidatus Sumerlaeota bacterium]
MPKPKSESSAGDDPRRRLASVSALLEEPDVLAMIEERSRSVALKAVQTALQWFRERMTADSAPPDHAAIIAKAREWLARREQTRLRPVVNAAGILLHTGLGRAVLPQPAVDALSQLNRCCNLQIDLETGLRGKRDAMVESLLVELTGAEAAMVVNNNAAATFLILAALCNGKEVIVSRGQLIEIGGSFRLPDCVHQSGAILVEVGTTNKTHLRDYEQALNDNTAAILRVNPSNYRVVGFTKEVSIAELVSLKQKRPVLVIDDLGCGALVDMRRFGLPDEPTVPASIAAGADLACFSGDKLIGGPQAGILVGKREWIDRIRKHPLTRMLRVDKMTDMALEHTLRLFLNPDTLPETNPTFRMLTASLESLKDRAERLKQAIGEDVSPLKVSVVKGESATGGGSLPVTPIPTYLLSIRCAALSAERISYLLRRNKPPIIARIRDDAVLLDVRTLLDGEDETVIEGLKRIAGSARE